MSLAIGHLIAQYGLWTVLGWGAGILVGLFVLIYIFFMLIKKKMGARFWWYWVITLGFTTLFYVGGVLVVDWYNWWNFWSYALVALPAVGLMRYFVFEHWWRKLKN